jgi:hypothetical protein
VIQVSLLKRSSGNNDWAATLWLVKSFFGASPELANYAQKLIEFLCLECFLEYAFTSKVFAFIL